MLHSCNIETHVVGGRRCVCVVIWSTVCLSSVCQSRWVFAVGSQPSV